MSNLNRIELNEDVLARHQSFASCLLYWMTNLLLPVCAQFRSVFANYLLENGHNLNIIFLEDNSKYFGRTSVSLLEKLLHSEITFSRSARLQFHRLFITGLMRDSKTRNKFAQVFIQNYPILFKNYMRNDLNMQYSDSAISLSELLFTFPSISKLLIEEESSIELLLNTFLELNRYFHEPAKGITVNEFVQLDERLYLQQLRRSFQLLIDVERLLLLNHHQQSSAQLLMNDKLRNSLASGVEVFARLLKRMSFLGINYTTFDSKSKEDEENLVMRINFSAKITKIIKCIVTWASGDEQMFIVVLNCALKWFGRLFNSQNKLKKVLVDGANFLANPITCFASSNDGEENADFSSISLLQLIGLLFVHSPTKFELVYRSNKDNEKLPSPAELIELPLQAMVNVMVMQSANKANQTNQCHSRENLQKSKLEEIQFDRQTLLALQALASLVEPNELLIRLLHKFNLLFLLKISNENDNKNLNSPYTRAPKMTDEQTKKHIEGALCLVYLILTERFVPGLGVVNAEECLKRDAIQCLCKFGSLSKSKLLKNLAFNERDFSNNNIENLLSEVADFQPPTSTDSTMKPGKYVLKEELTSSLNPFYRHFNQQSRCESASSSTAHYYLNVERNSHDQDNEKTICTPPPALPDFAPHFTSLNGILISDVFFAFVKSILDAFCKSVDEFAVDHDNDEDIDGENRPPPLPSISTFFSAAQFHLVLYIFGSALQEELKNASKRSFQFASKCIDSGVAQLLAQSTLSHLWPVIEIYGDLFTWLFDKFAQVYTAHSEDDKSEPLSNAQMSNRVKALMNVMLQSFIDDDEEDEDEEDEEADEDEEGDEEENDETSKKKENESSRENSVVKGKKEQPTGQKLDNSQMDKSNFKKAEKNENTHSQYSSENSAHRLKCFICKNCKTKNGTHSSENDIFLLCTSLQPSTVLSQKRNFNSQSENTCIEARTTTTGDIFVPAELNWGIHLSTCGHYMHSLCYEQNRVLLERIKSKENGSKKHLESQQNCPLMAADVKLGKQGKFHSDFCHNFCDTLLPVVTFNVPRDTTAIANLKSTCTEDVHQSFGLFHGLYSIIVGSCDASHDFQWIDLATFNGKFLLFLSFLQNFKLIKYIIFFVETFSLHKKSNTELLQLLSNPELQNYFEQLQTEFTANGQIFNKSNFSMSDQEELKRKTQKFKKYMGNAVLVSF